LTNLEIPADIDQEVAEELTSENVEALSSIDWVNKGHVNAI
jgi:hypothetical protein